MVMLGEELPGGSPAPGPKPLAVQQPANGGYQQFVVIEDKYRWIFVHCRNPVPQAPCSQDWHWRCRDYATP
jgi:hypothetical protein